MQATTASAQFLNGDYMLLVIGGARASAATASRADARSLQLLIPQHEVAHTGYMHVGASDAQTLMDVRQNDGEIQFALSEELLLLPAVPDDRFVYTKHADAPEARWCWSDVRVLTNLQTQVHPLAPVMLAPHTPLTAVVALPDGSQAFTTSASSLSLFVQRQLR